MPSVQRDILPGGLRLIVEERKNAPLTAIEIRVRTGSSRETPEESGLAHLVEHMVFKGSADHPSGAVDAEMELLGGEINARTTRDSTQFSTVVPSAKWKEALGLLAGTLLSPLFNTADLENEAKVIAAEMAVARTDPARDGFSRLAAVAYDPADAARLPLMGTDKAVATATSEKLRAFHQKWYRPENITVVLVGGVRREEARKFAGFLFQGQGAAAPIARPDASAYAPLGRVMRAAPAPEGEQKGRALTTVLIAFRAPTMRTDDSLPVFDTLMAALASGQRGRMVERLVKKEGVALAVAADFVPGRNVSLLLFTITTRPKLAGIVERSLIEEIKRLHEDTLTKEEVDRAAATVLGRVGYTGQSVEGRASWLAALDIAAPLLDPETYSKRVAAIKPEELNKLIENYLSPLAYAIAEVGPPPPPDNPEEDGSAKPNGERGVR